MCGINGLLATDGATDGRAAHRDGGHLTRKTAAARVRLSAQIGRWLERYGVQA